MSKGKQAEQDQDQKDAEEQGQPSNDGSIYYPDVEPTAVGQGSEEPRPDPTAQIRERYMGEDQQAERERREKGEAREGMDPPPQPRDDDDDAQSQGPVESGQPVAPGSEAQGSQPGKPQQRQSK